MINIAVVNILMKSFLGRQVLSLYYALLCLSAVEKTAPKQNALNKPIIKYRTNQKYKCPNLHNRNNKVRSTRDRFAPKATSNPI